MAIIVTSPGQFSVTKRNKLEKEGHTVIVCKDPSQVLIHEGKVELHKDPVLMAALYALTPKSISVTTITKSDNFILDLYRRLEAMNK